MCDSGLTYVKLVKKYGNSGAKEESFNIFSGSTLLYTDSGSVNGETRTVEHCLAPSTNNQYTLELLDAAGDSWSFGSLLTIYGKYGNAVFKNFMTDPKRETYTISLYYGIEQDATWKMTSGSVSAEWTAYSFDDTTWSEATLGSDIPSVSGVQYFRKQFVGLAAMAAYDVRLKYKAGVIAYINGAEVYRDNMPAGDVTLTTATTGEYSETAYRGFIRPGSEVASQNSILAVEIHNLHPEATIDFNAYLAILAASTTESNCFIYADKTTVQTDDSENAVNLFDFDKSSKYSADSSRLPMSLTATYTFEGPRPFINSVRVWTFSNLHKAPGTFTWQGSNDGQQWLDVISVPKAVYQSETYQTFNSFDHASLFGYYRAKIVGSRSSDIAAYEMQPLICSASKPISITFTPNAYTFWASHERVNIRPDSSGFTSCTAQSLPKGLTIDYSSCVISGVVDTALSDWTVTVSSVMYGNVYTGSFTLTILECTGDRSLISLAVRSDNHPKRMSYKLYQGVGTSGAVVQSIDQFEIPSYLKYVDFCLDHGIYTLELLDPASNGWILPTEYFLSVDSGEMVFEMGQISGGMASVSTMFSSYLPFQTKCSDWKISYDFVKNWNTVDFDDSTWKTAKAREFGANTGVTTYIRKEVNIPNIHMYQVLNVRVKYEGGVVAYFNGHKVARFNLVGNYDAESESISVHDQHEFSKFHIILNTVGGVNGKNLLAFEIHRPVGKSSLDPVIFDATGVFGVNECSIVLDSYEAVSGANPSLPALKNLLEINPKTFGYQPIKQGATLQWMVENLEGTKFNSFGMQAASVRTHYGFSLSAAYSMLPVYFNILEVSDEKIKEIGLNTWSVPKGLLGFRKLQVETDNPASSNVYVSSYMLMYCKPAQIRRFPYDETHSTVKISEIASVSNMGNEEHHSPHHTIVKNKLRQMNKRIRVNSAPENLEYESSIYQLALGANIYIPPPTYDNTIDSFFMIDGASLPAGLTLDPVTGAITGVPTEECSLTMYTIYGRNDDGIAFTTIAISVDLAICPAQGMLPTVTVGTSILVTNCTEQGDFEGAIYYTCELQGNGGVWNIVGECTPIGGGGGETQNTETPAPTEAGDWDPEGTETPLPTKEPDTGDAPLSTSTIIIIVVVVCVVVLVIVISVSIVACKKHKRNGSSSNGNNVASKKLPIQNKNEVKPPPKQSGSTPAKGESKADSVSVSMEKGK